MPLEGVSVDLSVPRIFFDDPLVIESSVSNVLSVMSPPAADA